MNAARRLLHLVHGQGDELATPSESRLYDEDVAPDAARVIQPPIRTPEDDAYISRVRRWSLVAVAAGFSLMGALLGIADAKWVP